MRFALLKIHVREKKIINVIEHVLARRRFLLNLLDRQNTYFDYEHSLFFLEGMSISKKYFPRIRLYVRTYIRISNRQIIYKIAYKLHNFHQAKVSFSLMTNFGRI
jgi:hypothetical protein